MLMAILRFIKVTIFKPFIEDCFPFLLLILPGAFYAAYFLEYWGTVTLPALYWYWEKLQDKLLK
ncbi:hypothetical protein COO59_11180 [Mixta theicola]|uniref:Uncharacterized protein n=1 Tax=Mixta theicola TaxID=1458355 RepID=A0A2K1Q965_9GAMM|nr:hypothetical protein [Mixta theicola]PNS11575.1 hypothetical protein COO59_11180 [Mixta theicola]GLR08666.1 hypothetical protein GCM10007905_13850 [Mixta theicola]